MDKKIMTSKLRVLLNAEPFGFGPAAAIAMIADGLKSHGIEVSYVGEKHTLDLQQQVGYKTIQDISVMTEQAKLEFLKTAQSEYDLFVTAMDFKMAGLAQKAGFKTVIYDALAWYWPSIDPAIEKADLYIAQNFFGVRERAQKIHNAVVVPPIVAVPGGNRKRTEVVINLGGLQNPFWDFDDAVLYACTFIDAIKRSLPADVKPIITTSTAVADVLGESIARAYHHTEMAELLAVTKYAFMTPGLGNIYDAAAYNIPTLWLPAANDTQGRQAELLTQNGYADARLEWADFTTPVDYGASQLEVLKAITINLKSLQPHKIERFLSSKITTLISSKQPKVGGIIRKFGTGGSEQIVSAIIKTLERPNHASN
jgi:hypothetical protein